MKNRFINFNDDNYSYDPNTEIGLLIWNLSQEGYTLTDKDVNLLKRYYNRIVNEINMDNPIEIKSK